MNSTNSWEYEMDAKDKDFVIRELERSYDQGHLDGYKEGRADGYTAAYNHALVFWWMALNTNK